MPDNKHVKTLANSGTLTGLAAGIRWDAKKVIKKTRSYDPESSSLSWSLHQSQQKDILRNKRSYYLNLSRFAMNANKFAAVCTIIETKFIFYLSDIEEELNPKFHDECLLAKLMRSINKMKSIAIVVGGALINGPPLLMEAISQIIWVETRIVLKKRRRHVIPRWRSIKRPMNQENRTKPLDWIIKWPNQEAGKREFGGNRLCFEALQEGALSRSWSQRATAFRLIQAKCSTKARWNDLRCCWYLDFGISC